ncbi:hypothetical protein M8494_10155 [Serratia ureilytica]
MTASYAGLRPATEQKHYRIQHYPERQWICVAGSVRSHRPDGGARHRAICGAALPRPFLPCFTPTAPQTVHWLQMPMLCRLRAARLRARTTAASLPLRLVTQREIEAAFDSAVPPECIGGLRRRTRVMMGRCNGFIAAAGWRKWWRSFWPDAGRREHWMKTNYQVAIVGAGRPGSPRRPRCGR